MADYTIFADNVVEADWFRGLSPLLRRAMYKGIGARGTNGSVVDDLIRYDRPDIILLDGRRAVLVVEKTREVPTGHNVGQRIARLVRAAEARIPVIKFFPFDARKHGDYSGICNLNIRLLRAFERMTAIHDVPVIAVNWPSDRHGELIDDDTGNDRVRAIVADFLAQQHNPASPEIIAQQEIMKREYSQRVHRYPAYSEPPKSVRVRATNDILRAANVSVDLNAAFVGRTRTLVYTMDMSPAKCRREDPYTGTQFIYDYIWCRSGPAVADKHTNLVLQFPSITRQVWYAANPNVASAKSSNWYITANALWFKDGLDLIR